MLCKKCGAYVYDGIKFCPNCGMSMEETPVAQTIDSNVQGEDLNNNVDSSINSMAEQPVESVNTSVNEMTSQTVNDVTPVVPTYNDVPSQPVNNVPPVVPMNNNVYNNTTDNNNNNKGNSGLTFVIVAIVVALLVCGGIIYWSSTKDGSGSNSNSNSNQDSNVTSDINSNITSNIVSNPTSNITSNITSNVVSNPTSNITSNITSNVVSNPTSNKPSNTTSNVTSNKPSNTTSNANYYAAKFSGYTLQIPKTYTVVSSSTSQLQLMGTNGTDVAIIGIQSGQYETLKANLPQINTYVKQKGYSLNKNATVKNYGGVEYITIEVSQSGKAMILAYAKLSNDKIFMIVIGNTQAKADYSKLTSFAYTVKTAKVG